MNSLTEKQKKKISYGYASICSCGKPFSSRGVKCRDCLSKKCEKCGQNHFRVGKLCSGCFTVWSRKFND